MSVSSSRGEKKNRKDDASREGGVCGDRGGGGLIESWTNQIGGGIFKCLWWSGRRGQEEEVPALEVYTKNKAVERMEYRREPKKKPNKKSANRSAGKKGKPPRDGASLDELLEETRRTKNWGKGQREKKRETTREVSTNQGGKEKEFGNQPERRSFISLPQRASDPCWHQVRQRGARPLRATCMHGPKLYRFASALKAQSREPVGQMRDVITATSCTTESP